MTQIFDTHTHYNVEPLVDDWQKHWQQAQEKGVSKAIIVGSNLEDSQKAIEIADQDENLYPAIGIHPEFIKIDQISNPNYQTKINNQIAKLDQLVTDNRKLIIAIGEIGLDYYWLDDKASENLTQIKNLQKKLFIAQLQLANVNNLPIIIHCRDKESPENPTEGNAYWDLLKILESQNTLHKTLNFVLHCASGPESYIKQAVKLGAYVGFDGNITYKSADNIRKIFHLTPNEKRLIETDAPFLPPIPHRGKTCQPWMISFTAKYIETNFNQDSKSLYENGIKFFRIDQSWPV